MKKEYTPAVIEIAFFDKKDILCTSSPYVIQETTQQEKISGDTPVVAYTDLR